MLNFFRRIRRKLLQGGKLKKYLIYAFGEVFLVIIGILIALQVNNWNEARKTSTQADQLAAVLYQELLDVKSYHERFFTPALSEEIENTGFFLKNWTNLNVDTLLKFRQAKFTFLKNRAPMVGIHGFQFFYDPEFPFYKTAFNDGTLSTVENRAFVNQLSLIYNRGNERMAFFESTIGRGDQKIEQHILENYHTLFAAPIEAEGDPWNNEAFNAFFKSLKEDNQLRYLISSRHSMLEAKKYILEGQVNKSIDKAIELYDEGE